MIYSTVATPRYVYTAELANIGFGMVKLTATVEAPRVGYIAHEFTIWESMGSESITPDVMERQTREALVAAYRKATGEKPRNLKNVTECAAAFVASAMGEVARAVTDGSIPAALLTNPSPIPALCWMD